MEKDAVNAMLDRYSETGIRSKFGFGIPSLNNWLRKRCGMSTAAQRVLPLMYKKQQELIAKIKDAQTPLSEYTDDELIVSLRARGYHTPHHWKNAKGNPMDELFERSTKNTTERIIKLKTKHLIRVYILNKLPRNQIKKIVGVPYSTLQALVNGIKIPLSEETATTITSYFIRTGILTEPTKDMLNHPLHLRSYTNKQLFLELERRGGMISCTFPNGVNK